MQLSEEAENSSSSSERCDSRLALDGRLLKTTLNLISVNLDSCVDGVSDCISSIVRILLKLKPLQNSNSNNVDLHNWLFDDACQLAWCIKYKYLLLAAILEHIPVEQVLNTTDDIMIDLCQCLESDYLMPSATQAFQCLVNVYSRLQDGLELWRKRCWPLVFRSLNDGDDVNRSAATSRNVSQYWLKIVIRTWPVSPTFMLAELERSKTPDRNNLFPSLSVVFVAKQCNASVELESMVGSLEESLFSANDDLRLIAFNIICISPRQTDPLTSREISILKRFLPLNMNIDSPPFRKQLQTCLHSALVRVRDSSLSQLRQAARTGEQRSVPDDVISSIDFIDWVWTRCFDVVERCGNYQRIQTSLCWTKLVLDVFCLGPNQNVRKGLVPVDVGLFLGKANNRNQCQFFTKIATSRLFSCLFNDVDEICEMALEILTLYFPWPLTLSLPLLFGSAEERDLSTSVLLSTALCLSQSPRVRDSHTGSIVCGMIFEKSVVCLGERYVVGSLGEGRFSIDPDLSLDIYGIVDPRIQFLSQLLDLARAGLEMAAEDVVKAAMSSPIHGIFSAVRRCVTRKSFSFTPSSDLWQPIVRRIISHVTSLIELVLSIFGGRLTSDGTMPSFEQITMAIDDVIGESSSSLTTDEDEYARCHGDVVLSPKYQLVSTWCWLNIRESSLLLGSLVSVVLKSSSSHDLDIDLLSPQDLRQVGNIFLRVMTCCRHKGAIESSSLGFSEFCLALFRSHDLDVHSIPGVLLHEILSQIYDLSESSVTRRSAGLPLVVQVVLASEAKVKQNVLLKETIGKLLDVLSRPLPNDADQQRDVAQVHAVNILTAVIREKSLTAAVFIYLDKLTVYALRGFLSSVWAMRNSSVQFFSFLLSRLVGEKKKSTLDEGDLLTTQAVHFFRTFPSVCDYVESVLESAVRDCDEAPDVLTSDPTLVPVLSILKCLGHGIETNDSNRFTSKVRELIMRLSSHKLYAVRQLSAQALVPLLPNNDVISCVQELVDWLPNSRSEVKGFNRLHGTLLQIECLIQSSKERSSRFLPQFNEIVTSLRAKSWLLTSVNPCPLIRTKFLQILTTSCEVVDQRLSYDFIEKEIESCFTLEASDSLFKLGDGVWQTTVVSTWLTMSSQTENYTGQVVRCLTHGNLDIVGACLSWLVASGVSRSSLDEANSIQVHLWRLLRVAQPWKMLCDVLEALFVLYVKHREDLSTTYDVDVAWNALEALISRESDNIPSTSALKLSSFLIERSMRGKQKQQTDCTSRRWFEMVCERCYPTQLATVRHSAAHALKVAAPDILALFSLNQLSTDWCRVSARIFWAIVLLLNDEQTETRDVAAETVRLIVVVGKSNSSAEKKKFHFNHAIEAILDHAAATWCQNVAFSSEMYRLLVNDNVVEVVKKELDERYSGWELFQMEDANPFLEEEHLTYKIMRVLERQRFEIVDDSTVEWLEKEIAKVLSNAECLADLIQSFKSDLLAIRGNKRIVTSVKILAFSCSLLSKWSADVVVVDASTTTTTSLFTENVERMKKQTHDLTAFLSTCHT